MPGFELTPQSALLKLREEKYGGSIFTGTSGENGEIKVRGLARGTYYTCINQDLIPFSSFGYPVRLDIPGSPVTIVVRELWASVISYVGDPVVIANRPNLGRRALFRSPSSRLEYAVVRKATDELKARYPGAQVLVGRPRREVAAQKRGSLQVFAQTKGWYEHDVELLPISSWVEPQVVVVPFGGGNQTAELTAFAVDGESHLLDLPEAAVFVQYDNGSFEFNTGRSCAMGVKTLLPAGSCKVYPSGRLRQAFEPFAIDLKAGSDVELPIDLSRLRAYRFVVKMPDGSYASSWGARLHERGGPLCPSPTPSLLIYSTKSSIDITAYVHGYRGKRFQFEHHLLDDQHGIVQDFELTAGEFRGLK